MPRVRLTEHANSLLRMHGITLHDIIEVISGYEIIEMDIPRSGQIRAGKEIRDRMIWVVYTARGNSLIVVDVSIEESNNEN